MTKKRLSDAVNPGSAGAAASVPAASKPESGKASAPDKCSTKSEEKSEDSEENAEEENDESCDCDKSSDEDSSDSNKSSDDAGQASSKTLADFRSVFGHELGSVYWADQVDFTDACVKEIARQSTVIKTQGEQIISLEARVKDMTSKLAGEEDPLSTGPKGGTSSANEADPVSSFAAAAQERLEKKNKG